MKKTVLLIVFLCSTMFANAQCPTTDITLSTQTELDNFVATYATTCTDIPVNISVSGTVTDTSGLNFITSISGSLSLSGFNQITHITGFDNLISVGGDVVFGGYLVRSVNAFNTLVSIGGDLVFYSVGFSDGFVGMTSLNQINGDIFIFCSNIGGNTINTFSSLGTLGGDLKVRGEFDVCTNTVSFNFLNNLQTITGNVTIDVTSISILGLENIQTINGNLEFKGYSGAFSLLNELTTINGDILFISSGFVGSNVSLNLPSLTSLSGGISIDSNSRTSLFLNNLTSLGGSITSEYDQNSSLIEINSLTHMDGSITLDTPLNQGMSFAMNSLGTMGGSFSIKYSQISLDNFSFNSLYAINGNLDIRSNETFTSMDIFQNLFTIGGNVSVRYNDFLQSLAGLETVQNIGGQLIIENNLNLQDCSAICEYVSNNTNYTVVNNTLQCVTSQTCTSNIIQGTILQDLDLDGCTAADIPLENIEVIANDGTNSFITYTDAMGAYSITVPEGTYSVYTNSNSAIDIIPGPQNITFSGTGNTQVIDFCATFNTITEDVSLTIAPIYIAVPGFESRYSIIIENEGTTIQNGTINFTFSDANLDFVTATIPPTTQAINTLTWDYTNLIPGESRNIIAFFNVLTPPTNNIGDILTFSANAPLANDINPNDNQDNIFQVVLSSFDPNDKTVIEGEHLLIEDIDKYIHYVIRFQNEGTSPAVNIRIADIMSDLLDWETFEPIDASHNYAVDLMLGNSQKLEFLFNNINLPDSTTDEPNSHGYIAFRVKPKSTVQVGDFLNNRAAIYFDFNAPIITNQTKTRIVEDSDADGIYNYIDNCPNTPNMDQSDIDGDGIGDVCDDDTDGDGILDVDDNCPNTANAAQADFDVDGIGDECDDDDDNDGILDTVDNCVNEANPLQEDFDGDGIGDACDDDDDDDGILDVDDNCPTLNSSNQDDFDGDGLGDECDDDDDNDGILDVDDACPYYVGTTSGGGCPFSLPVDNFSIETTSETCVNQNNASIHIQASANHPYEVNLLFNGTAITIPVNTFTQELIIENLSAGTYELCISIPAENYEQCFTLEIEDPAILNANSSFSRSNEYSLSLIGATMYTIFINEESFTVHAPNENTEVTFTKQLTALVNNIEVRTEKVCQGKYLETVQTTTGLDFLMTPNPSSDEVFISLTTTTEETTGFVIIYDVSGRVISSQTIQIPTNNHKIDIRTLNQGIYFVQLSTENNAFTKKLIKK